ncbi:MAG: 4Fe-4S dicluster domain-containing protein [Pseudomonadota bacterium]
MMVVMRDSGVKAIPFEILPHSERAGTELKPVRYFVINGIGHGFVGSIARRLLVEKSPDILEGARLVKRMLRPEKIHLVISEEHEDVIQAIQQAGLDAALEVIRLKVYYPLGHPHLLFKALFNKEIPCPGGKAIDMGVVFTNVDTIIHTFEAIELGKPLIERYVTVSGSGIKVPKHLKVRIGTPLKDLVDFCGGFEGDPGKVSLGNPLDGMAQFSLDRPVLKDTRWVWVQAKEQVIKEKYRACINCGECVHVCPVGLMPNFLGRFCEFGKFEEAASQFDLFTCIDCGLCAYVCPSRRPLVQFINYGRMELSLKEKEHGTY